MSKRMLIDASHPEETRVVVLDGTKVEEFDFEAASKRLLKGNIYLAKVTRVEPSLQAAFIEYGGNRQGFLAFPEIHPDYYQIPVADRQALLADQSRQLMEEDEEDFDAIETGHAPARQAAPVHDDPAVAESEGELEEPKNEQTASQGLGREDSNVGELEAAETDAPEEQTSVGEREGEVDDSNAQEPQNAAPELEEPGSEERSAEETSPEELADDIAPNGNDETADKDNQPAETVKTEATGAPAPRRRRGGRPQRRRYYKIQEVIKRRQVILVQVVKEERGNKGAALTTFLSLAGRYCVLMPNTPRGGGISRKITSATDRRRLKSAAQSLELPEGMGLIIRTAGANRTKTEIKRDYEYLLRLWDTVRELTLQSNAPALVYEEGNLIKRSIRDLYNKDISEVLVDGEAGYRDAKDFMRMLTPSHAKNVKPYKDALPLFQHYSVEAQLDAMFSPTVTLKSGGYIVINQTEALVAIDVNSGKATREHSIEETAHKTNLEAADEISRQLRLRDLAGLIVIDFIDMEESKNNRNVEKRLREAIHGDRARLQIGKISQFGLLEMSRQRLRAGVVAGSTVTCPYCIGVGLIRSTESAALRLLRALEEEGQNHRSMDFLVRAPEDVVIYTLNQKRREVARIEDAYNVAIQFNLKEGMAGGSFEIERTEARPAPSRLKSAAVSPGGVAADQTPGGVAADQTPDGVAADQAIERSAPGATFQEETSGKEQDTGKDVTLVEAPAHPGTAEGAEGQGKRKRRKRRRGGRGRGRGRDGQASDADATAQEAGEHTQAQSEQPIMGPEDAATAPASEENGEKRKRRRRRGRRGRRDSGDVAGTSESAPETPATDLASGEESAGAPDAPEQQPPGAERPMTRSAAQPPGADDRKPEIANSGLSMAPNAPSSPQWSLAADRPAPAETGKAELKNAAQEPHPRERAPEFRAKTGAEHGAEDAENRAESQPEEGAEPRKGWWQRRFGM